MYGDYALGYGAHGDLLVDGGSYDTRNLIAFAQLSLGTTHLKQVVLSKTLQWAPPTFVQWDGQFWVVGARDARLVQDRRQQAEFEGYTFLPTSSIVQFWIAAVGGGSARGNQIVVTEDDPYKVEFFQYPAGGQPFASIIDGLSNPYGITVSKASKQ